MKKKAFNSLYNDDYKLLSTSYQHQAREYFDNSTLHGVRYIAEKGRPFCERFMWFCFTVTGAVATCIIIVSLWEKFQTNPTITGLDTDFHNWDVQFPSITLCDRFPNNPTLVDEFINKTWPDASIEDRELYTNFFLFLSTLSYASIKKDGAGYSMDPKLLALGDDLRSLVYSVVFRCEELLVNCEFKADNEDCCEIFAPMFTEIGFCYAFNSRYTEKTWPWLTRELDPYLEQYIYETNTKWSFIFDTLHKDTLMNVYIHSTDEMPGMDTNPQHIWDKRVEKISFSVKQTYTTPDARQLSIKQRRCVFADEIKLVTDTIYTYSACTRQCRMILAKKYCGCVPFFYAKIDKFRYCTLGELRCIAEHADEITNIDKCNCELGCANTVYEVEKLTEQDRSQNDDEMSETPLESEFVSWPMVRYKREVLFGWVDLLVSFGGIAGLFLGFSLLSGVEIIYYFTLRACCMFYSEKDQLKELKMEYSQKSIPPYDLSLKPWWKKPPTASLHGPKAVMDEMLHENDDDYSDIEQDKPNDYYEDLRYYKFKNGQQARSDVKPKVFVVKEASHRDYSPPPYYLQTYLP